MSSGIRDAPVFRPTEEEWAMDPLLYIQSIRPRCQGFGICKIIPPESWKPGFGMNADKSLLSTRLQRIDRLGAHARAQGSMSEETEDSSSTKADAKKRRWVRCKSCKANNDQDKMVTCAECAHYFHLYCVSPPLVKKPDGPWTCATCVEFKKQSFGFGNGDRYTLNQYQERGDKFKMEWFRKKERKTMEKVPRTQIEKMFWNIVQKGKPIVEVEYASELDVGELGSGFPSEGEYGEHPWNLNNLARAQSSLLRHLDDIAGITIPWLYIGMLFSSFCWHNEDHYCYSISYNHKGAPKQWYGIPGNAAGSFEAMMQQTYPKLFAKQPDLLFQLVTLVAPMTLKKHGVPVCKATHHPGEFIVTFPQAYHAGFNYGFNVAEAVNFACHDWISWGTRAVEHYRKFSRIPVFSHDELLVRIGMNHTDVESCAWLHSGIQRIVDIETSLRYTLHRKGLKMTARWPKEAPKDPSASKKPRKRKYRNVVHKNDWKQGKGGREKGLVPVITDEELGGFRNGGDPDSSMEVLCQRYGKPNGNTQDHCAVCKYPLYISAVYCPCTPNLSCLKHAENLCPCSLSEKHIRYRFSLWELDMICERVHDGLRGKRDEKVNAIISESTSVFKNECVDIKSATATERAHCDNGEAWARRAEAFLDNLESAIRDNLMALLQDGRSYVWSTKAFHKYREIFEKLLHFEVKIQKLSKYVKRPAVNTGKNDKRASIEEVLVFSKSVVDLPEGLKGQEYKELSRLLDSACEIQTKLKETLEHGMETIEERRRRKPKPTWEAVEILLQRARKCNFAIPQQNELQEKLDQVTAWLKEYEDIIKNAETSTCFTSMRTRALNPNDPNRRMRLKRKKNYTLQNFAECDEPRHSQISLKKCKQMLRLSHRLPVALEMQQQDLEELIGNAQSFNAEVQNSVPFDKQAFDSRLSWKEYLQFRRERRLPASNVDMNLDRKGITLEKLLHLYSESKNVALKTKAADTVRQRLIRTAEWDKEARRFLLSLNPVDCFQGEWEAAKKLLKGYMDLRLSGHDLSLHLEHVLAWREWAQNTRSALDGVRDFEQLLRLRDEMFNLVQLEDIFEWPRKSKFGKWVRNQKVRKDLSDGQEMDFQDDAKVESNRTLQQRLSNALEIGSALKLKCNKFTREFVNMDEESDNAYNGYSLMHREKPSLNKLKSVLQEVSSNKFRNVGEEQLTVLTKRAKAWLDRARSALSFQKKKKVSEKTIEFRSTRDLKGLIDEAWDINVDLPLLPELAEQIKGIEEMERLAQKELQGIAPLFAIKVGELGVSDIFRTPTKMLMIIANDIKPMLKDIASEIVKLKAKFDSGIQVLQLLWCANVLQVLGGAEIEFSTILWLHGENRSLHFANIECKGNDLVSKCVKEVLLYTDSRIRPFVESGNAWTQKFKQVTSRVSSIAEIDALLHDTQRLPMRFKESSSLVPLKRRCLDWIVRARHYFPEIFEEETLGLLPTSQIPCVQIPSGRRENLVVGKELLHQAKELKLIIPSLQTLQEKLETYSTLIKQLDQLFLPRPKNLRLDRALRLVLRDLPLTALEQKNVVADFGEPYKNEKGEELYCFCCRPTIPNVDMVCCDTCNVWFHVTCINIPKDLVSSLDDSFDCPKCCLKKNKKYPYPNPTVSIKRPRWSEVAAVGVKYKCLLRATFKSDEFKLLSAITHYLERIQQKIDGLTSRAKEIFDKDSEMTSKRYLSKLPESLVESLEEELKRIRNSSVLMKNQEAHVLSCLWRANVRAALADPNELESLEDYLRFGTSTLSTTLKAIQRNEFKPADISTLDNSSTSLVSARVVVKSEPSNTDEKIVKIEETATSMKTEPSQISLRKRSSNRISATPPPEKKQKRTKSGSPVDAFPELKRLRDTIHQSKKLRIVAKRGISQKWGPHSKPVEAFLKSCDELDRVEIPEVTQLKSQVQLYCVCKSLYVEGIFMIGCDKCGDWFHPKCIGISESEAQLMDDFVCKTCRS
eukprot:CAMPEP_0114498786 /NCGR_PEP_ID=MMETSP0109-20121206/7061_1 /TAXON_ID=29199 /ORGANISM="Chlorarachnion reptans, Strain CCCM449" /LENGTH=1966 /DNA_ID=CAMNT_0001676293 /DNA_START=40 /DNA_END=5940 /DNA_ORIENTATION=+